MIKCDSGMAVDETVIAVIGCSDSELGLGGGGGGLGPRGLLHLPRTHSGLDSSVRELEDTMCLPDHSTDIDPEHENYFPRPGSGLVNMVLLFNCVPDLGGCPRDEPGCAGRARWCYQLRIRARGVAPGR